MDSPSRLYSNNTRCRINMRVDYLLINWLKVRVRYGSPQIKDWLAARLRLA